jgi:hypothetical protein
LSYDFVGESSWDGHERNCLFSNAGGGQFVDVARPTGARVALKLPAEAGGKTPTRWVEAGSGYAAQSAFPLHFGLGDAERAEAVEIAWPSGRVARLDGETLGINRTVRYEEAAEEASVTASLVPPARVGG